MSPLLFLLFFFFNDTATTEISTLSLHDALPISPFLKSLPLNLTWVESPYAIAHPLDDGTAGLGEQALEATHARLGGHDARAWRRMVKPFVDEADVLFKEVLGPVPLLPRHPFLLA